MKFTLRTREVATHCEEQGATVDCRVGGLPVHRFAHYEDARCGDVVWFRGAPTGPFSGDVLIAHTRETGPLPDAALIVKHEDPRGIIRSLIEKLGIGKRSGEIRIGGACRIHPSAALGCDGQSYALVEQRWDPFPHVGGLRIGDAVDVGPCCTIMRGSVGDTVIASGVKIGNGVNIGHDARVGEDTLIVAGAQIAGWARIGRRVRIWQGALIKNGVRIGDDAIVGMGAVVLEDVPDGQTWAGNPARRIGGFE